MSDAVQARARRGKRKSEQDSNPRLGALDTPIPFSKALEEIFSPKSRLVPALRELVRY